MVKRHILIAFILALLSVTVAAQSQPPALRANVDPHLASYQLVSELSGELVTIDSEWMDDVMKLWVEGFEKRYPNMHLKSLKRDTVGAMGVEPALTDRKQGHSMRRVMSLGVPWRSRV